MARVKVKKTEERQIKSGDLKPPMRETSRIGGFFHNMVLAFFTWRNTYDRLAE